MDKEKPKRFLSPDKFQEEVFRLFHIVHKKRAYGQELTDGEIKALEVLIESFLEMNTLQQTFVKEYNKEILFSKKHSEQMISGLLFLLFLLPMCSLVVINIWLAEYFYGMLSGMISVFITLHGLVALKKPLQQMSSHAKETKDTLLYLEQILDEEHEKRAAHNLEYDNEDDDDAENQDHNEKRQKKNK